MRFRFYLLVTALFLPAILYAQNAPPSVTLGAQDVHFQIALAGDKHVFRAGEPVRITLTFTADCLGYQLDSDAESSASPDASANEEIFVTPESGLFPWLHKYAPSGLHGSDEVAIQPLTANPVNIEIVLNGWYSFDQPGTYTVHITSRRASTSKGIFGEPFPLTSNYITFEIQPMSDAEEVVEVQRISHLLDTSPPTPGTVREYELVAELSHLTGDAATREKVRRLLDPGVRDNHGGNYEQYLMMGLYQARNMALAVQLLEAAIGDNNRPLDFTLLDTLPELRSFVETMNSVAASVEEQETARKKLAAQYRDQYLAQVAATLPQRSGENLTDTAITILIYGRKSPAAAPAVASARKVILEHFASLDPFTRDNLLGSYWNEIHDPSLIPALEKMLTNASGAGSGENSQYALERLIELNPDDANRFIIAEICNPNSFMDLKLLESLPVSFLPEADEPLLASIRDLDSVANNRNDWELQVKLSLAARYATPAIYNQLLDIYKSSKAKWQRDTRAKMLAYLLRNNQNEAIPLAEQELAGLVGAEKLYFSFSLVDAYYSPGTEALYRHILETADPIMVGYAASVLSQRGPSEDQALIEARLDRWAKERTGTSADTASADATAKEASEEQVSLVKALLYAKSWKLSSDQLQQLQQKCISDACRKLFHP
jgi:hypothetical protein